MAQILIYLKLAVVNLNAHTGVLLPAGKASRLAEIERDIVPFSFVDPTTPPSAFLKLEAVKTYVDQEMTNVPLTLDRSSQSPKLRPTALVLGPSQGCATLQRSGPTRAVPSEEASLSLSPIPL